MRGLGSLIRPIGLMHVQGTYTLPILYVTHVLFDHRGR
jgi:hypothetical protein